MVVEGVNITVKEGGEVDPHTDAQEDPMDPGHGWEWVVARWVPDPSVGLMVDLGRSVPRVIWALDQDRSDSMVDQALNASRELTPGRGWEWVNLTKVKVGVERVKVKS